MPAQTTEVDYIIEADGAKVQFTPSGGSPVDLGAVAGDITATLAYDTVERNTGNAGELTPRVRNMRVDMSFGLLNLDPSNIADLGAGLFEEVATTTDAVTTMPDQVIAADWEDNTVYELVLETSSTDSTLLKASVKPTIDSVKIASGETEEQALTVDSEYVLVESANYHSGWGIIFISAAIDALLEEGERPAEGYPITIAYSSVTPVARTSVYAGTTSHVLSPGVFELVHTDSDDLERGLTLYSVTPNSGGFNFGFKGANSDDMDSMEMSFTAKLDTTRTDGRQLLEWFWDNGAA